LFDTVILLSVFPEIFEKVSLSGMNHGEVAGQAQQVPRPPIAATRPLLPMAIWTQRLEDDRIFVILIIIFILIIIVGMNNAAKDGAAVLGLNNVQWQSGWPSDWWRRWSCGDKT
jgi:hypothetical protein